AGTPARARFRRPGRRGPPAAPAPWERPRARTPSRAGALPRRCIRVSACSRSEAGRVFRWRVAPMPGLVHDAVRIAARVAHREAVIPPPPRQPVERPGRFERFLGWRFARGSDVQRAAEVVLTEARCRGHGDEVGTRQPARQLALENAALIA